MKKIIISLIVGSLMVGLAACGMKTLEKDVEVEFEKSVFIGDSITEGFVFNEILPKEAVIAGAGATAGFTYDDIGDLVEKKPDNIFIMLGSIDILMPVDDPKELFRNDLTKLINKIREELPECKIYLQSITPVTQGAIEQEPRYVKIKEYNEVLKDLAVTLPVNYINLEELMQDNSDLYAEDGIHFKKEFYQLWLEYLLKLI